MGLGKTISAESAIRGLIRHGKRTGALVVVPLRVLELDVWQNEAKLWEHTQDLTFSVVRSTKRSKKGEIGAAAKERIAAMHAKADIYLTNYENLQWLARMVGTRSRPRKFPMPDILVLDESTMISNQNSMRFKALKFRLLRFFKTVIILTGTPMPQSLLQIWPQIYVLDKGDRLGTSADRYKQRFFEQQDYQGYKWEPRTGALEYVLDLVKDITVRLDAEDWVRMPKIVQNVVEVALPPDVRDLYDKHEHEMFTELKNYKTINAVNAATLSMQCHQIANGAVYDDELDRNSWTPLHDAKLDALEEIIESHAGQCIMVAYWFRHDLIRLRARWPKALVMGQKYKFNIVDHWNVGLVPLMFLNPANNKFGLNMQHGGHVIVWFSLTWSEEAHTQLIGRLRRPDQKSDTINSHYLIARGTVDEAIRESNLVKSTRQRTALDILRAYVRTRGHK